MQTPPTPPWDAVRPPPLGRLLAAAAGAGLDGLAARLDDPATSHAYHALLTLDGGTCADFAAAIGAPHPDAARTLDLLKSLGLATRSADNIWAAQRPPEFIQPQLQQQAQALEQLARTCRAQLTLTETYWRARDRNDYEGIEVIYHQTAVVETSLLLQQHATKQVRAFMRSPYHTLSQAEARERQRDLQRQRNDEGVAYQAIYEPQVWEDPVIADDLRASIASGEEARQLPSLPMKLILIDNDRALVPLDPAHHADTATLVVHPSGLLTALNSVFDFYWSLASPKSGSSQSDADWLDQRSKDIILMLASGADDNTIARTLKISRSTVTRTITNLQARLLAKSRFQLGAQAARSGLI